jgi:hypothetical protein
MTATDRLAATLESWLGAAVAVGVPALTAGLASMLEVRRHESPPAAAASADANQRTDSTARDLIVVLASPHGA